MNAAELSNGKLKMRRRRKRRSRVAGGNRVELAHPPQHLAVKKHPSADASDRVEGAEMEDAPAAVLARAPAPAALPFFRRLTERRSLGQTSEGRADRAGQSVRAPDDRQLPRFFAECVFQLTKQKYEQLMRRTLATHNVAAVVMTAGYEVSSAQVVAMATGTKCLDRDAGEGALRDCHAEVVCRRALLRFLYAQLETLLMSPPEVTATASIFEAASGRPAVFRLRDRVGFHMFVTWSPCGDARLENLASRSGRARGGLRTKVSGGQGTMPVAARRGRRKRAGGSPGQRRGSMSCTDKMAKWCAVGVQGALLSHLLEPIYLRSLTVATSSHAAQLRRTLARRLLPNKRRVAPYRRQLPLLACLGWSPRRTCGNWSRVSVNWSHGDGDPEELAATSGLRRRGGTPSRLSGRHFFERWRRLHGQLNDWTAEDALRTHDAWKRAAVPYQKAVRHFGDALRDGGLGTWRRKVTQSPRPDRIPT
ncbi:double-stranded RNA-specific editase B2-like [Stigmatopora argus]